MKRAFSDSLDQFENWWKHTAQLPKFSPKDLARTAWEAAFAASRNYVADESIHALQLQFANGRVVTADHEGFLFVSEAEDAP